MSILSKYSIIRVSNEKRGIIMTYEIEQKMRKLEEDKKELALHTIWQSPELVDKEPHKYTFYLNSAALTFKSLSVGETLNEYNYNLGTLDKRIRQVRVTTFHDDMILGIITKLNADESLEVKFDKLAIDYIKEHHIEYLKVVVETF